MSRAWPCGRAVPLVDATASSRYGGDTYVFKPEAVRDHVTVYPEDSLLNGQYKGVEGAFMPWGMRMLLAPKLEVVGSS